MLPRELLDEDMEYWRDLDPRPVLFAADDPTFEPCAAVVTTVVDEHGVVGQTVVRVPWTLSEIELMHLAKGGTIWLSAWGGLPPHMLEVQPPAVLDVFDPGAV